jgi:bacterial leucyl aminopeptidase
MMKKNRVLPALFAIVALLAFAALFLADQNKAGQEKTWLTMDAEELRQMRESASRSNRSLAPEVVRVENGVAVVRATEDEIALISEHAHRDFHKCGGFIAHESETAARETIANFARRAESAAPEIAYTINNAATVQALSAGLSASNILQTITTLSTEFNTRFYNSPTGLQSATWIKNHWAGLAAARNDVTVEFFNHPSWQQPSVILTIPGTAQPNEVVILGAHQDSVRIGCFDQTTCQTLPAPGADDDASGIASLTELLRVAVESNYRPAKTVKFMAYAGEERGLLGSAAIASNYQAAGVNVVGVLQLDMTNYKSQSSATDIAIVTDFTNAAQNQFLRDLRAAYLPALTMTDTTCGYGCSDHASWHNRGYPASFPFEAPFGQHNQKLHTADDTLANSDTTGAHALKFAKLAAAYLAELAKGAVGGPFVALNAAKRADFDGDGKTDVSVFRPADGNWHIALSASGGAAEARQFGLGGDRLAPADFDGDAKTDLVVYRGDGNWYVLQSRNNSFAAGQFGTAGDIPVAADYDGDAKADHAVFRPSNGVWYYLKSSDGQFAAAQFGTNGDKPVIGDYDGDGKFDFAVFRPSSAGGIWYVFGSQSGFWGAQFGLADDRPVQADYDGDGKTDLAVYRPSGGYWYLLRSQAGFAAAQFGIASDTPAPGDFDGDGKDDLAVYRDGTWYLLRSQQGFTGIQFGAVGDRPIPSAYLP